MLGSSTNTPACLEKPSTPTIVSWRSLCITRQQTGAKQYKMWIELVVNDLKPQLQLKTLTSTNWNSRERFYFTTFQIFLSGSDGWTIRSENPSICIGSCPVLDEYEDFPSTSFTNQWSLYVGTGESRCSREEGRACTWQQFRMLFSWWG